MEVPKTDNPNVAIDCEESQNDQCCKCDEYGKCDNYDNCNDDNCNDNCNDENFSTSDLVKKFNEEMNRRREQDKLFARTTNPFADPKDLNELYTEILTQNIAQSLCGKELKKYMLKQINSGDFSDQGKPINVPLDFHKGPFMNPEDEYLVIFEAECEANIRNNCNHNLIKTIGNTEITYGMKAFAEGIKWNNGLICYNGHNILIRDVDNVYGQPGYLFGFFFMDRLAVEIMNRYIVVELKSRAKRNEFTITTNPKDVITFISEYYQETRSKLINRLNDPLITEILLFTDSSSDNNLDVIAKEDDNDHNNQELEQRVKILEDQVAYLIHRLEEVEEIALDSAIGRHEQAIEYS